MNKKLLDLLMFLISNKDKTYTLQELGKIFSVSPKSISNYLTQIRYFLDGIGIHNVISEDNGIRFSGQLYDEKKIEEYFQDVDFNEYALSGEERCFIICVYLLMADHPVTLNELTEMLYTNKVTILSDMKEAAKRLSDYGIQFAENRHKGYELDAVNTKKINALFELSRYGADASQKYIDHKVSTVCGSFFLNILDLRINCEKAENAFTITEEHFSLECTDTAFYDAVLYLSILMKWISMNRTVAWNEKGKCFPIAERIFSLLYGDADNNKDYVRLYDAFLESHHIDAAIDNESGPSVDYYIVVESFLRKLSEAFHKNIFIDERLQAFLTAHVMAMSDRLNHGEKIGNGFKDRIIDQYGYEFNVVKENKYILEQFIGKEISDDEIAYLLMYILTALGRSSEQNRIPRVLVACHGGISTSYFLADQLRRHFKIEITDIVSTHIFSSDSRKRFRTLVDQSDCIISTVPIAVSPLPWLQVSAMPDSDDYEKIEQFLKKVTETTDVPDNKITEMNSVNTILDSQTADSVSSLLTDNHVILDKTCSDWKEAIIIAGEPLLWDGQISPDYLMAMINSLIDNGPYIVFTPGVALAHANPKYGAKKLGASFLRLSHPVCFGNRDNDPVSIVMALSVIHPKECMPILLGMMNALCSRECCQKLLKAENASEIRQIFTEYQKAGRN